MSYEYGPRSYELEPRPELLDATYWEGIDINNPVYFPTCRLEDPLEGPETSLLEYVRARKVLGRVLGSVVRGKYYETAVQDRIFDPKTLDLKDGSVVALCSEGLMSFQYNPDAPPEVWRAPQPNDEDPISFPFAEVWRANAGSGDIMKSVGYEEAVFLDEHIRYHRKLSWGVLLSRRKQQFLTSWPFVFAEIKNDAVEIQIPNFSLYKNRLESLPMEIGAVRCVEITSNNAPYIIGTRSVSRVTEIHLVGPAQGSKEKIPKLRELVKAKLNSVTSIIPRPSPLPA